MQNKTDRVQESAGLKRCNTCLILSMRHLGDAVILAGFANALKRRYPDIDIDVLGRMEMREVTASFCTIRDYIPVNLPFFGHHKKGAKELKSAIGRLLSARRQSYDCCINLMGDIRENVIGKLIGTRRNIAPIWNHDNLFRRHIRVGGARWFVDYGIPIPSGLNNIYESIGYFATQLGLQQLEWPEFPRSPKTSRPIIAIHPGASQPSKRWQPESWRRLVRRLHERGNAVVILGSPSERHGIFRTFSEEIHAFSMDVVTESLPRVLESMSRAEVLVGMDSFSVHAGHALGIPVVVLHGPFDPSVMTPPGGIALSSGHSCKFFPCYNKTSCRGAEFEYICVRGIEVNMVIKAIDAQMAIHSRTSGRRRATGRIPER